MPRRRYVPQFDEVRIRAPAEEFVAAARQHADQVRRCQPQVADLAAILDDRVAPSVKARTTVRRGRPVIPPQLTLSAAVASCRSPSPTRPPPPRRLPRRRPSSRSSATRTLACRPSSSCSGASSCAASTRARPETSTTWRTRRETSASLSPSTITASSSGAAHSRGSRGPRWLLASLTTPWRHPMPPLTRGSITRRPSLAAGNVQRGSSSCACSKSANAPRPSRRGLRLSPRAPVYPIVASGPACASTRSTAYVAQTRPARSSSPGSKQAPPRPKQSRRRGSGRLVLPLSSPLSTRLSVTAATANRSPPTTSGSVRTAPSPRPSPSPSPSVKHRRKAMSRRKRRAAART